MGIEFSAPWWWLLVIPAAALLIWWWRVDRRWGKAQKITLTSLRAVIFLLLIMSLAGLQLKFPQQGQTVVFVADQSASVNRTDAVEDEIREALEQKDPQDRFAIVAVGGEAVVDQSFSDRSEASPISSVVTEHQTDLASGLRLAGGLIPEDSSGRIVLISDGEQTRGDAVQESALLRERGIQVDTIVVEQEQKAEVLVTDLKVPSRLFPGESYAVGVQVNSTVATDGTIRLYDGNREVDSREIEIEPGENRVTFTAKASSTGFHRYRIELDATEDTIAANNQTFAFSEVMGEPVVLVVEGTEDAAANLTAALEATETQVDKRAVAELPTQLETYKQYASIVLADVPAFQFGQAKMDLIRAAVRDLGVGLIMTGGKEGFGMGGWFRTPVEEALPVYMDIRDKKRSPSLGLVLVIDKSGSMAGTQGGPAKIELAKEAANRSTQMLSPQDQVGVVAFDGTPWWVVEPVPVDDVTEIQNQIGSITADGGTDIYPALQTAYEKLNDLNVKRKHIILLTDGHSATHSPYDALIADMTEGNITLSTVAVGQGADTALLERLAQQGGGRYYPVMDETTIPTIFSKETALATQTYLAEDPFQPQWVGGADWHDGIDPLPPLGGYVVTTSKERAESVIVGPNDDPIAARWPYGLGRSVAWTSDLSGNWSSRWIDWPSFRTFVNRMVSWTFPQYEQGNWQVETSQAGGKGKVTLNLGDGASAPEGEFQVTVVRDDLSKQTYPLKADAPGSYSTDIPADEPGTYLLQVSEVQGENVMHTQTYGMAVSYSPEYRLAGNGVDNMEAIAQAGDGRVISEPGHAFADLPDTNWDNQPVGQWCLWLAMLLLPFDIAFRRLSWSAASLSRTWARVTDRFRGKQPPAYSRKLAQLNVRKTKNTGGMRETTSPTKERRAIQLNREDKGTIPHQGGNDANKQDSTSEDKANTDDHNISDSTDRMSRLLEAKKRGRR